MLRAATASEAGLGTDTFGRRGTLASHVWVVAELSSWEIGSIDARVGRDLLRGVGSLHALLVRRRSGSARSGDDGLEALGAVSGDGEKLPTVALPVRVVLTP